METAVTIPSLALIAQREHEMIAQRTKDALAVACKRLAEQGRTIGNPNGAAALRRAARGNSPRRRRSAMRRVGMRQASPAYGSDANAGAELHRRPHRGGRQGRKAPEVTIGALIARETVAVARPRALQGDTIANRAALKGIQEIQISGVVSARGIARELAARRMPTPAGGKVWAPAQVQRLLRAA